MASMRSLRRRLLRWRRYEYRVYGPALGTSSHGYARAIAAFVAERDRREALAVYWPYGSAPDDEPCGCGDCRDGVDHGDFFCGDPDCSCGEPDDDAGHGDDWPPYAVTLDVDRGLL